MKKNFRFLAMAVVAMAAAVFTGCSSDDDFLAPYEESAIQTRAISSTNALIDFDNVPGLNTPAYVAIDDIDVTVNE